MKSLIPFALAELASLLVCSSAWSEIKQMRPSEFYEIKGVVSKPKMIRPPGAAPYLTFNLKTIGGANYMVLDYHFPTQTFKRGKPMRIGNTFTYRGRVFPDPTHSTRGILKVTAGLSRSNVMGVNHSSSRR